MTSPAETTVRRYMQACNDGDPDALRAAFAPDVEAYFIDIAPVRGREALAQFWRKVHEKTGALWTCDRVIAAGDEVVVEWTETWLPRGATDRVLSRGVDLFVLRDGLIREIRQYHRPAALPWSQPFEMQGFDYPGRGYPTIETFDRIVQVGKRQTG